MNTIYNELGLRPIINASATLTRLGGSRMPDEVLDAMRAAAASFVDLFALQERVGEKLAVLTQNEAAYVSSGAAAGIMLSVASCITGPAPEDRFIFPALTGIAKKEVIVWKSQRNGYDFAITQTGATIVEVGNTNAELEAAISERTACIFWFAGSLAYESQPIQDAISIAKNHGVPFIVDAAAQIPPVSNLWNYTKELGATGAIFSGGKGIRGPQSSGLVVGTNDLIAGCRINGSPNQGLGRPSKVGKEEMAGLAAAVEYTLAQDETRLLEGYEEIVHGWIEDLSNIPGVTAERRFPSEAGQPHGRTIVTIAAPSPWTREQVVTELRNGDQHIEVAEVAGEPNAFGLNPQTLDRAEADIVAARLRQILTSTPKR